jgi:hypothetical protein
MAYFQKNWVNSWRVLQWKMLVYVFYDHLVYCTVIWYIFCGNVGYFMVIWYSFPVLVCCTKKNMATLGTNRGCNIKTDPDGPEFRRGCQMVCIFSYQKYPSLGLTSRALEWKRLIFFTAITAIWYSYLNYLHCVHIFYGNLV